MASITFEAAVELAKRAHAGQVDQAGRPYFGHVLRVADTIRRDTERFAALLGDPSWPHRSGGDVARIEDTDVTPEDLREAGCDEALVASLIALTKREGEAYSKFLERLSTDPVAVAVKRADIADNADEARLSLLPLGKAAALRAKYRRAEEELGFWLLYRGFASLENDHPDGRHVYFRKLEGYLIRQWRWMEGGHEQGQLSRPERLRSNSAGGLWEAGSSYDLDAIVGMGEDPYSCGEWCDDLSEPEARRIAADLGCDLDAPRAAAPTASSTVARESPRPRVAEQRGEGPEFEGDYSRPQGERPAHE